MAIAISQPHVANWSSLMPRVTGTRLSWGVCIIIAAALDIVGMRIECF